MPRASSWSHLAFTSCKHKFERCTNYKAASCWKYEQRSCKVSPGPRHAAHLFKLHGHVRSLYAPHYPSTWKPSITTRSVRCSASASAHYPFFHFLKLFTAASRLFSRQTSCAKFIAARSLFFFNVRAWNLLLWEVFEPDVDPRIISRSD